MRFIHEQSGEFRFQLLLVCLFGAVLIPPYFEGHSWFGLVWKVVFTLVLLASAYSVIRMRKLYRPALVLMIPTVITVWLEFYVDQNEWVFYLDNLTTIGFMGFIGYHFLRYILECRVVTTNVIYASMCLYLILAIMWAAIYANIHLFYDGAFNFSNEHLVVDDHYDERIMGVFSYYSFVTLSTLGYGDITPINKVAQAWVSVEAMIGQFYIAIIMARLVSMHAKSDKQ